MSKDVTTVTRYFFILLIIFVLWLFLFRHFTQTTNIDSIFGTEKVEL